MKCISEQSRVSGRFPISVNGTKADLTVGEPFADTPPLLSALDGADIAYEDAPFTAATGVPTGRIRITSSNTAVRGGINGTSLVMQGAVWFTPTDEELEVLNHSSYLTYIREYEASAEENLGPELFVNTLLNDDSGWVLDAGDAAAAISGNKIIFPGGDSAVARVTPTPSISAGSYRLSLNVESGLANVRIGDFVSGTIIGPFDEIVQVPSIAFNIVQIGSTQEAEVAAGMSLKRVL